MARGEVIGFYVPTPTKDIAIAIIGETLEATLDSNIRILDLTVKYFFVEPEHTTKGTKSHKINYEIMVKCQETHLEELQAHIFHSIQVRIDREFILKAINQQLS